MFVAVSELGATGFVVLLSLLCYFCVDKDLGRRLSFTGLLSFALGGFIKDALRLRRPIGLPGVRSINPDSVAVDYTPDGYPYSYSMPSGHAQTSATTWGVLSFYYRRWPIYLTGVVLSLTVALSRVYLGLHNPSDVAAGLLLGLLIAAISALAAHYLWDAKMLYAAVCLLMLASFRLAPPSADTVKAVAALCGLTAGCYVDDLWVKFRISARAGRNLMALAGVVAVEIALGLVLRRLLPAGLPYDFARYFILLFVASGPYPALVMFLRYRERE